MKEVNCLEAEVSVERNRNYDALYFLTVHGEVFQCADTRASSVPMATPIQGSRIKILPSFTVPKKGGLGWALNQSYHFSTLLNGPVLFSKELHHHFWGRESQEVKLTYCTNFHLTGTDNAGTSLQNNYFSFSGFSVRTGGCSRDIPSNKTYIVWACFAHGGGKRPNKVWLDLGCGLSLESIHT